MKKNIAIILTVMVIIGGTTLIVMLLRETSVERIERLLPKTTLAYLSLSDLSQAKEDIKGTRLWHALEETELLPQLRKLWGKKVEEIYQKTGISLDQLTPFFNRGVAIAITSFNTANKRTPGVVIAVDVADNKRALNEYLKETMSPQFKEKGLIYGEAEHRGIKYHYWQLTSGERLCYGFLKNIFVVSITGEKSFNTVVDTYKREISSLRKSRPFKQIKSLMGYRKGALGYLNLKLLLEQSTLSSSLKAAPKGELLKLSGLTSLETIGYYSFVEEEGFRERFFLATEKHPKGLLKTLLAQPPRRMNSPEYIPRRMKNLTILTFNDPPELWEEIDDFLSTTLTKENYRHFKEMLSTAEKGLNFSFQEDLLECLGNELAMGTDITSFFPLPENLTPQTLLTRLPLIFLIKVDNQKKLSRTMDRALARATLTLKTSAKEEKYGDHSLKYIELELAEQKISPSYAFIGDFLVMGNDRSVVREAIDTYDKMEGIGSAPDFSLVRKNLFRLATWFTYSDTREILKAVLSSLPSGTGEEEFDWQGELTKVAEKLFGTGVVAVPTKQGIRLQAYSSVGLSTSRLITIAPLSKSFPFRLLTLRSQARTELPESTLRK